ncbi:ubiquinol--cytochrome-c reductase subunit 6, partial [Massospora cicadina]
MLEYLFPYIHADELEVSSGVDVQPDGEIQVNEENLEEDQLDEAEPEDEEESEDPVDIKPALNEACGNTPRCEVAKHHLHACEKRVANGSKENCAEEFLHFQHCVDEC